LKLLATILEKKYFKKGDILIHEGLPQTHMYILAEGSVIREKIIKLQNHHIDTKLGGHCVGSLHVLNEDPSYATARCITEVVAYELSANNLKERMLSDAQLSRNIALSLSLEIRRFTRAQRTPLLETHPKKTPVMAVSFAAAIESFYRSALNAVLNQHLTGVKMTSLFPNMWVQTPTRIVYINGFKGIRHYLDSKILSEESSTAVRLMTAITPGVCMTPVSSILEACNAGHSNPEPLYKRWTRGVLPRGLREVIFGIGLNQLSDYCEERIPLENQTLKTAGGSLTAGVISGYLSHVVHNLSTLKLMNPTKSYKQHFQEYVKKSECRVPASVPASLKPISTLAIACILPSGVLIRTSQIVGSFIILNGTISALQNYNTKSSKFQ